jgi:hypothetical protein
MGSPTRGLGILIGVVLLAMAGTAWAGGIGSGARPEVSGTTAQDVTSSSVTLKATVLPHGAATYLFEYGTSETYGFVTPQGPVDSEGSAMPVSAAVSGLAPSTTYHFRIVATNSGGVTYGPDRTFTTLAGAGGGDPGTGDPGSVPQPGEAPPQPTLGSTVMAAPTRGEVRVRRPGSGAFVPLELGTELPVGTVVDAVAGTLALTSALPSGATQTAHFGGGRFLVRQGARGYLDLYLRGRTCAVASTASAATAAGSGGRRLWGRDHGGRYRTHGRNSHATVRGTRWLVADTCKGTLTRVTEGSVVVTDKVRHKRVVLDAGERYLAKPRR